MNQSAVNTKAVVLLLCGLALSVTLQAQKYYRDINQPSVFVTFRKVVTGKPLRSKEGATRIWLQFHNNTEWDLRLPAFGVPPDYGDCGLFFEVVVSIDSRIPGTSRRDRIAPAFDDYRVSQNYSTHRVKPGGVLNFSVPSEALAKGLAIRIPFNYGWESQQDVAARREPVHFVIFSANEVPAEEKHP